MEPLQPEYAILRARIRRSLGDAYLAVGRLDNAADAYKKALEAADGDAAATTGLAVVEWLQKQTEPALKLLDGQIAADPRWPRCSRAASSSWE